MNPSAPQSAYDALSDKQRAFVDAYIECGFNASEAARRAGYKRQANTQGPRMVANGRIRAAIAERCSSQKLSADEVLARIRAKLDGDLGDFIKFTKDGIEFDIKKARLAGKSHLARRLEIRDGKVVKLELCDALKALELMGRALGLFERDEKQAADDVTLDWSDGAGGADEADGEDHTADASSPAEPDRP